MELIQIKVEDGRVNADFSLYLRNIIPSHEFPLSFRVEDWMNGETRWEAQVYPGWYALFDNAHFVDISVYTRSGKLLKRRIYDPYMKPSKIDEFFRIWASSRNRTEGLVLGAGNGTWGEWVLSTIANDCRVVLVEADPDSIPSLRANHGHRSNVTIVPLPVTAKGGIVQFWKAGAVSSLHREVSKKLMYPEFEPQAVELQSVSASDLIEKHFSNGIDWIRVDIEGADHEIMMSIDDEHFRKMSLVIFETLNMSTEEMNEIVEKLKRCGFNEFQNIEIDTVCIKL